MVGMKKITEKGFFVLIVERRGRGEKGPLVCCRGRDQKGAQGLLLIYLSSHMRLDVEGNEEGSFDGAKMDGKREQITLMRTI